MASPPATRVTARRAVGDSARGAALIFDPLGSMQALARRNTGPALGFASPRRNFMRGRPRAVLPRFRRAWDVIGRRGRRSAEMKFVIYGVGAVGGVLAAKLALSGAEVVGIARGPQLDALRKTGLRLTTPEGSETVRFGAAGDPDEVQFAEDDVVMLADEDAGIRPVARAAGRAPPASPRRRSSAPRTGVTSERFALRRFPNVYAMAVILPSTYSTRWRGRGVRHAACRPARSRPLSFRHRRQGGGVSAAALNSGGLRLRRSTPISCAPNTAS